jgi:hypothetical protein
VRSGVGRIDAEPKRPERHPTGDLDAVAHDDRSRGTTSLDDGLDRLRHTRFAIGFAESHQPRRPRVEPGVERVQPQRSVRQNRQARDIGRGEAAPLANAGMVGVDDGKTRKHEVSPVPHPVRRQAGRGGLGRSAREDDGLTLRARQRGDIGPGLRDDGSRSATFRVDRRRIARDAERGHDRILSRFQKRRARIVIQIDTHLAHSRPSCFCDGPLDGSLNGQHSKMFVFRAFGGLHSAPVGAE